MKRHLREKLTVQDIKNIIENGLPERSQDLQKFQEMAYPIKQIIEDLHTPKLRQKRLSHLLLIFYFRDTEYFNYWVGELSGYTPAVAFIKGKHKRPPSDFIYTHLWKGYDDPDYTEHLYQATFENALDDEEENRKKQEKIENRKIPALPWVYVKQHEDIHGVHDFTESFHLWISTILASEGVIKTPVIREKINELIHEYPYQINS
jgi:hypothetical protein